MRIGVLLLVFAIIGGVIAASLFFMSGTGGVNVDLDDPIDPVPPGDDPVDDPVDDGDDGDSAEGNAHIEMIIHCTDGSQKVLGQESLLMPQTLAYDGCEVDNFEYTLSVTGVTSASGKVVLLLPGGQQAIKQFSGTEVSWISPASWLEGLVSVPSFTVTWSLRMDYGFASGGTGYIEIDYPSIDLTVLSDAPPDDPPDDDPYVPPVPPPGGGKPPVLLSIAGIDDTPVVRGG